MIHLARLASGQDRNLVADFIMWIVTIVLVLTTVAFALIMIPLFSITDTVDAGRKGPKNIWPSLLCSSAALVVLWLIVLMYSTPLMATVCFGAAGFLLLFGFVPMSAILSQEWYKPLMRIPTALCVVLASLPMLL